MMIVHVQDRAVDIYPRILCSVLHEIQFSQHVVQHRVCFCSENKVNFNPSVLVVFIIRPSRFMFFFSINDYRNVNLCT